jgi:prepilin-type N-terminal cleavage/methylation domain-containing protein
MDLKKINTRGFSLVELMVAMAIASIVMGSIYRVYYTQQMSATNQHLVIEMQQNARSALTLMKREIRMAGYKPAASDGIDNDGDTDIDDADPDENGRSPGQEIGIVEALQDQITFRMDIRSDNPSRCTNGADDGGIAGIADDPAECYDGLADDPNEQITYALQANAAGDGDDLVRITSSGTNILAYDIEALAFGYAYDWDAGNRDGALETDNGQPDGNVFWAYDNNGNLFLDRNAETGAAFVGPRLIDIADGAPIIGAVRIWLLVRTPQPVKGDLDTQTYQVGDLAIDPSMYDPRYRRTLQIATVYCRNLRF